MSVPPSVPGTAMRAPARFRTAILFDDADAAMAARAAGIRDGLDPMWFAPELWPARGDAAATDDHFRSGVTCTARVIFLLGVVVGS